MNLKSAFIFFFLSGGVFAQVWQVKTSSDPLNDQVTTSAKAVTGGDSGPYEHQLELTVGDPPDLINLKPEQMNGLVIKAQFSVSGISPTRPNLLIKFRIDSNPVTEIGWAQDGRFSNIGSIGWQNLEKDAPEFDVLGRLAEKGGKYEGKINNLFSKIKGLYKDDDRKVSDVYKKEHDNLVVITERLAARQKICEIIEVLSYFENAKNRVVLSSLVDNKASVVFQIDREYSNFARACQSVRNKVVAQLNKYDATYRPLQALESIGDEIATRNRSRLAAKEKEKEDEKNQSTALDAELKVKGKGYFEAAELDQAPIAIFQARPEYPFEARRAGKNGEVLVAFIIDPKGAVQEAVAVRSSHKIFEADAIAAVQKWRFKPGLKKGVAVPSLNYVPIVFSLNEEP